MNDTPQFYYILFQVNDVHREILTHMTWRIVDDILYALKVNFCLK